MSVFGGAVPQDKPEEKPALPAEAKKTVVIEQVEIDELMRLEADVKLRKAQLEAKLLEGAVVAPGSLFALIERGFEKKQPSKTFLKENLGAEKTEELWSQLGSREYERLKYGLSEAEVAKNKDVLKTIEKSGKPEKKTT